MKTVLLVEDDRYISEDIKYFIEAADNKCDVYNTAEELFSNIDKLDLYDVVVLDIMMRKPDCMSVEKDYETGEQLYEMIRVRYPKKKVIILSAKNFRDMKINFEKERDVETVEKPLSPTVCEIIDKI